MKADVSVYRIDPQFGTRRAGILDPLLIEYKGVHVNVRSAETLSGRGCMPYVRIDVLGSKPPKDCDGDDARLARFNVLGAHQDMMFYPALDVMGFLDEWTAVTSYDDWPAPTEEGSYIPMPDPEWEPRHVMVCIRPCED